MGPQRMKLVALVGAAFLLAPATTWAQGAVDEQYRDPFAGQDDRGSEQQDTSPPAPDDGTAPSSPSAAAAPAPEPTASASDTLPRTGLPVALVAIAGGTLVAAGTTLRRRLR